MATHAVPAQVEIPVGTPVEISSELAPQVRKAGAIYTNAKYALFTGYGKHYEPTQTYVNLLVHDKGTDFKPVIVTVPVNDLGFSVVKPSRAKMLDKLYKAYTKANVTVALQQMSHGVLGTDPEMFVRNSKTGEIIPSWLFLKSKEEQSSTYKSFWDGFQGEFTVEPSYCNDLLVNNIRRGLLLTYTQVKEHSADAVLCTDSVVEVPQQYLRDAEDKHVMFGCMPSKNVYGAKGEHAGSGRTLPLRFAGGHIHFSKFPQEREDIERTVKTLDAILGVVSVPLFRNYDNPVRRNYYGLAGEYRTPSYGMEYRTLSNAWLCHPAIAHLVLDLARTSAKFANAKLTSSLVGSEQLIQDIINNGDVPAAQKYIKKNKDVLAGLFKFTYRLFLNPEDAVKSVFRLIDEGVDAVLETPRDVEKNWLLDGSMSWQAAAGDGQVRFSYASRSIATGKKV